MISDQYKQELNNLLNNKNATPAQITVARGRLILALGKDIRNNKDNLSVVNNLKSELMIEMAKHKNQLNMRLYTTKSSNDFVGKQIVQEVAIKGKKVGNSVRQFTNSQTKGQYISNGAKVIGNTLSTVGSIAKAPIIATLKLTSLATPVVGKIIVQPLQIPGYLFSKIINPDHQYNGKTITNIGKQVGELIASGLVNTSEFIRRM